MGINVQHVALLPRTLGSLFYFSPSQAHIYQLLHGLEGVVNLFDWRDNTAIERILREMTIPPQSDLSYQFSVLFEGQGIMVAPPWGAVYLDKDGLLMSESTMRYRAFLADNQLLFNSGMNEPEDQFGLMLLALAQLLEQERLDAAQELLEQHLLTWSAFYLQRLQQNEISPYYASLAEIATLFLAELRNDISFGRIDANA